MAASLRDLQCFIFDMDGTINLGETPIDGAKDLISFLQARRIPFFFFTNNSSASPEAYAEKLQRLGFSGIGRERIVTSGDVMAHFLKQKFSHPHIYLAGTPSLAKQLREQGIALLPPDAPSADAVVIGFDTTFSFEKATAACRLIAAGVPFSPPTSTGSVPWRPGPFSRLRLDLRHAGACHRRRAQIRGQTLCGKPWIIFWPGRELRRERTAMVGDRLYTDIATAKNGGIVGIAVLSGEISQADIDASPIQPDYTLFSVKELYEAIR